MPSGATVRVGISDFQFLTRKALSVLISEMPGFDLVCAVDEPARLQSSLDSTDVLIVDVNPSDLQQIDAVAKLNSHPKIEMLVITNSEDRTLINMLLKRGIKGVITKNCSEYEIMNAMKAVAAGNRFYCNKVLDMIAVQQESPENNPLSEREKEVLNGIAQGLQTQEIADQLHISVHTVNSHRKNIIRKLKLTSPVHLVAYAAENGLVDISFLKK